MQTSGGVNEQEVGLARLRRGDGIMGHGGGISPVRAGDDLNLQSLSPQFKLLDGRGTESVASGEHGGFILGLDEVGKFGAGRRFARTVNANNGNNTNAAGHFM